MPLAGVEALVAAHVPPEVTLAVSAPAARGLEPTLDVVTRLAARGYRVVPHLAARLVRDEAHLADLLRRLEAAGTEDVFVVAGDSPEPAGQFADALSLLEAMAALGHPFREVGVAGHPEGHPFLGHEQAAEALRAKAPHATYVVSNLCFDAATIAGWVAELRGRGVALPVHVGLPGPVSARRLARLAGRIGVGQSARFLRRHSGWTRLLLPGAYRPDRLLTAVAERLTDPDLRVAGVHVFTFNEIARTERWRRRRLTRLG
jgi:methylenetetrahydrofolate reductase (NADPH)